MSTEREALKKAYKIDPDIFKSSVIDHAKLLENDIQLIEVNCNTEEEIITRCKDAESLMICIEPMTRTVLEALPNLKTIARGGVGLDNIDLDAATELGVQVTYVPDGNITEVATHTIAMALSLTRRLPLFDSSIRAGRWEGLSLGAGLRRPNQQIFGIVGFGRIGQQIAERAKALGFNLAVSTPVPGEQELATGMGAKVLDFDDLVSTADVISVHVPLLDSTRWMFNDEVMSAMKPGAILINPSRGGLVDEEALTRHLKKGHLGGAGLDVFVDEPVDFKHELFTLPNVIVSPHVAYLSDDSLAEVWSKMVDDTIAVLNQKPPKYPANTL